MGTATIAPPNSTTPLRILLVDDDAGDARLVRIKLSSESGGAIQLALAGSLHEGLEAATKESPDAILLDLSLPDGTGLENVTRMLAAAPSIPVIVLTGLDDEQLAIDAVRIGAQDYIAKGYLTPHRLTRSVRHAIERNAMIREVQIAQQRENEVKDQFLSHVSHELRTPLTAIMQFVTILQDGIAGEINERQSHYLGIVRRNAEQLKHMIGTLMDVTRADAGKLSFFAERLDATGCIQKSIETVTPEASQKGVAIAFRPAAAALPEVIADPCRLTQVITNLLDNAVKFTPAGGRIDVEAAVLRDRPELLEISVRDTGCGIPADACDKVFDRLYQVGPQNDVSRKGLGLGLHICREIIKLHRGDIRVESAAGEGSRFSFTLPIHSLASSLRRVAFVEEALQPGVALIALRLGVRSTAAQAKGMQSAVVEATRLLETCMLGVSDVVLPPRHRAEDRGLVCGLARTDADGARAIERRVRGEVDRHPRLQRGFQVVVSSHCLRLDPRASGGPERALAQAAQSLSATITMLEEGGS